MRKAPPDAPSCPAPRGRAGSGTTAENKRARATRRRRTGGAEEAHPPGDRARGDEQRPELAEQDVEWIAGRVGDAEEMDGGDELAAVAHVDRGARAERVDDEDGRGQCCGDEP